MDCESSFLYHPQLDMFEIFRLIPRAEAISLGGGIKTVYPDRSSLEKLIRYCHNVKKFSDEQAFGITLITVKKFISGWNQLSSLSLNTEFLLVKPLLKQLSVRQWRSLKFKNFRQSLKQSENMACLAEFFANQSQLHDFELDMSTSHFLDGLFAHEWEYLLRGSSIKRLTYRCSAESYFEDASDYLRAIQTVHWTKHSAIPKEIVDPMKSVLEALCNLFTRIGIVWQIYVDV